MKHAWIIAPILMLAGCDTAPPLPPPSPPSLPVAAAPVPETGMARGIDMATDARDVAMELQGAARPDFVARYYRDPASHWPGLSAPEARTVSEAGMKLVAVWESHSRRPDYFSYASGYYDAEAAYLQAKATGQPPGTAIYFAVDFNAQEADLFGRIDPYFRGVAAGLAAATPRHVAEYRVGVYGSGAVCDYLKRTHLAQYAWLSNARAWSGYANFDNWDIRQGGRAPYLSFSQDSNEARGDYGGFRVAGQYSAL